jgi:hypothetical protein
MPARPNRPPSPDTAELAAIFELALLLRQRVEAVVRAHAATHRGRKRFDDLIRLARAQGKVCAILAGLLGISNDRRDAA